MDISKSTPLLLLDFDSTLTIASTLDPLLRLPTEIYKARPPAPFCNIQPPATAAQLSAAYKSSIKDYESSDLFRMNDRKDRTKEIVHQDNLRPIEAASFERGKQAFAAAGVTRADVHFAASKALSTGEVVFRKGWKRLLAKALAKEGRIAVISANWSKFWIESLINVAVQREGLVDAAGMVVLEGKRSVRKFELDVWANEVIDEDVQGDMGEASLRDGVGRSNDGDHLDAERIQVKGSATSIGDPPYHASGDQRSESDEWEDSESNSTSLSISSSSNYNIFVAGDKTPAWLAIEEKLAKTLPPATSISDLVGSPFRSIYIGDSITDFDILLSVDEGVMMRDEGKLKGEQLALKQLFARLGFSDAPVGEFGSNARHARLWWAKDFDEVVDSGIFGV
ncbi:MAG: hypothetical protein HETSPECPRED_000070 [Heterodermia speciosa]|uniref:HAD-like protein n=1 Tax=Heterodermia speciosa TaxID=116794 RepID=A0A8H3EH92_9LECA|nr:MAG: hypothetical protein HETSPECPRED_000070 [Heterodermia speciosa]